MHGPRNIVSFVAFFLSSLLFLASYLRIDSIASWGSLRSPGPEPRPEPGPEPVPEPNPELGPKPRYIFIDLGANGADSLEVFLQHEESKFQYDFPRPEWATHDKAGEYRSSNGEYLIISHLFLDIYLFEANPVFNPALVRAKEMYGALGINVNIFPSTVVDVKDGTRTFFLDTVNTDQDFWGSSIYATHPDAVRSNSNGTVLTSINFSRWLLMNTLPRDFVVIKMDVEGAEYELIPHMVEMGAWIVIDHLFIEWHASKGIEVPEEDIDRASAAAEKLKAEGVNLPSYDSAA